METQPVPSCPQQGACVAGVGNSYGQLGIGSVVNQHVPWPRDVITGVDHLSLGNHHVCVVRGTTGGVRCWGSNVHGELGIGSSSLSLLSIPPDQDIVTGVLEIAR